MAIWPNIAVEAGSTTLGEILFSNSQTLFLCLVKEIKSESC